MKIIFVHKHTSLRILQLIFKGLQTIMPIPISILFSSWENAIDALSFPI